MGNKQTKKLVLLSILTSLTVVLGYVNMPTPTGFVTLLDTGVFFTAFYLGKKEGAIVGGLSGLLIDVLLGYPQWAFFSLLFHGGQGYFAGLKGRKRPFGLLVATLFMVGGYFLASVYMYNIGEALAGVLGNLVQNSVGLVLGYSLYRMVDRLGGSRHGFTKD